MTAVTRTLDIPAAERFDFWAASLAEMFVPLKVTGGASAKPVPFSVSIPAPEVTFPLAEMVPAEFRTRLAALRLPIDDGSVIDG